MCKKQTSVSHGSTESEVISSDAGLRMDGLLALDLWDVVMEALCSTNNTHQACGNRCETGGVNHETRPKQSKRRTEMLLNVDNVPANAHSSQGKSQLCVFEDNEAVIKMIIEGRSPTVRHVARTHRVAVDWLFDRRNLDPKIQIKCVDTKNQLLDILTKGSFTRDEWNHLLHFLNIMNPFMFSRRPFFQTESNTSCRREDRIVLLNKARPCRSRNP